MTVATRLPVRLAADGGWRDTALALPGGGWRDLLTGTRTVSAAGGAPLADVLAQLPVALLVQD